MNLQTLKLFNLGSKESVIHGTCGFAKDAIWIVDGNNKITQIDSLTTKGLAQWWNLYINEHISKSKSLVRLINQGLKELKKTEFGKSELGISLVIARELENNIEILLIGDCEAILGQDNEVKTVLKIERNREITENLISKMIHISKNMNCTVVKSRKEIEEDLKSKVNGESEESYIFLRGKDLKIISNNYLYKKINKKDITQITLLNGGSRQYYTVFNIGDIEDMYRISKNFEFLDVYEEISRLEREDLDCNIYPRIKPIRSYMLNSVSIN